MTEPTTLLDTTELETQAAQIAARIPLIAITDQASLEAAAADRAEIKRRLLKIAEVMDPICDAAYKTWKTAVAKRDGLKAPFVEADKAYARAMGAYEQEQARRRREAEENARRERERREREERERAAAEEARLKKEAEDRRLAEAAAAEARGDRETAQRLIEAPIETPTVAPRPVFVPTAPLPAKPTADGVSFRDTWKAEVTDLMALVRAVATGTQPITLLSANTVALNQMARALKGAMSVPGVRAVNERIAAQKLG